MATQLVYINTASTGTRVRPRYTSTSEQQREFDLPRELRVSQQDFKLFLVALETDEEPNEKLKALFEDRE